MSTLIACSHALCSLHPFAYCKFCHAYSIKHIMHILCHTSTAIKLRRTQYNLTHWICLAPSDKDWFMRCLSGFSRSPTSVFSVLLFYDLCVLFFSCLLSSSITLKFMSLLLIYFSNFVFYTSIVSA